MEETRGGMAGDLGLDPVVVVSHSDRSVGCRVIVLAKRSEGTKATAVHLPSRRSLHEVSRGRPAARRHVPEHLAGHLPPRREVHHVLRIRQAS
jgi:hypothetical protein